MNIRALAVAGLSLVALAGCSSSANVATVANGSCVNISTWGASATIPTVSCATSHEAEVYEVFNVTAATYDEEAITAEAEERCTTAFEAFVGFDYLTSDLDFQYLYPSGDTWTAGDREVICAVFDYDWDNFEIIPTTGTLKGAGR